MDIPYVIFFYIYVGLVLLYLLFSFFDLFHVFRFGFRNFTSLSATFIFLAVSVLILFVSLQWLSGVDWTQTIKLELSGASNF